MLAVLAGAAGLLVGYLAQYGLSGLLGSLVSSTELPPPSWRPLLPALATGFVTLLGFGLPPLLRLREVPPLRVLRRDLGPVDPRLLALYGPAVLATAGAAGLAGRRMAAGAVRLRRRGGDDHRSGAGGLGTGEVAEPAARPGGRGLALRAGQHRPARSRQRGAGGGAGPGVDGAADADPGAHRPADQLAGQFAGGRAQPFPDQHPARRGGRRAGFPARARPERCRTVPDGARTADGDQWSGGGAGRLRQPARQAPGGAGIQSVLGRPLAGGQPHPGRPLVERRGSRAGRRLGRGRAGEGSGHRPERHPALPDRRADAGSQSDQPAQRRVGFVPGQLLRGVPVRRAGQLSGHLDHQFPSARRAKSRCWRNWCGSIRR